MSKIDLLAMKAQMGAYRAKEELENIVKEEDGNVIVTIALIALGLVIVGVIARIATDVVAKADTQVSSLDTAFGTLK